MNAIPRPAAGAGERKTHGRQTQLNPQTPTYKREPFATDSGKKFDISIYFCSTWSHLSILFPNIPPTRAILFNAAQTSTKKSRVTAKITGSTDSPNLADPMEKLGMLAADVGCWVMKMSTMRAFVTTAVRRKPHGACIIDIFWEDSP